MPSQVTGAWGNLTMINLVIRNAYRSSCNPNPYYELTGGALYADGDSTVRLVDTAFINNTADALSTRYRGRRPMRGTRKWRPDVLTPSQL